MNRTKTSTRSLILCPLLAAGPATASTQIGQVNAPYAFAQCAGAAAVETAVAPGTQAYTVPAGGGVITSWKTGTAGNAGSAKLKVFRPTGVAGQYLTVGESGPYPVASNSSPSLSAGVRVPVRGGDMIGLVGKGTNCIFFVSGSSYGFSVFDPAAEPAPGAIASTQSTSTQEGLAVSAVVEPDADADGYGDETQDQCPNDHSAQTLPCPVPAPPPARAVDSAGTRARLALRIPRGTKRKIRGALRSGKKVRAGVRVIAADSSSNSGRASQRIAVSLGR